MDAPNVAENPKQPGPPELDHSKHPPPSRKSPTVVRSSPPVRETRPQADDDGGASEAETIVLAKDGPSPSKPRKSIKHEAKSDRETSTPRDAATADKTAAVAKVDGPARDGAGAVGDSAAHKKKRQPGLERSHIKADSSGLSSVPTSPPSQQFAHLPPGQTLSQEKSRSADKVIPHKRKAPKIESEDEAEGHGHKARRQRTSVPSVGGDVAKPGRDHGSSSVGSSNHGHGQGPGHNHGKMPSSAKSHPDSHSGPAPRPRSVSPGPRAHRRSISTQLPSQFSNGLSHKKKRVPAPLQSTEYHSDESSASGSPRIRSSKLRSLTTPATTESNVSPAKMAPHKKHLDAHGQTFLARACARGEYEGAKQRLGERPEDLNVADFAGNTPLQIASINGYEDIVKLLLDAGCALDCVNHDKDTPLLDAVENGHVKVVKLLLDAGVNPRKANVNGVEPLDCIAGNSEESEEIRRLLIEAKQRMGDRRRTSEEHHHKHADGRESHGPESPRRSPVTATAPQAASGRRAATVRATKTSAHLLYMPMDDKTLRQAAGRGDEETVTRILQVRDTFDDPESMVAAARGGHDMIINLLLALGNANPDPGPVNSIPSEFATPMLAAIGQENIKVVELLLTQANFDPTRRFKGETYYEIARKRQGSNWKDEEHMLKNAYDNHKKAMKDSKTKSPAVRYPERDAKRVARSGDARDEAVRSHKRKVSSPSRETLKEHKKAGNPAPTKSNPTATSPKEKRRSNSFTLHRDDQTSPKRGPGRPKKEDRLPTIAVTDREDTPPMPKQLSAKPKRAETDATAMSSEGETAKPRRKLVSRRELKGEREKQRRASLVSSASSMKEPSSPRDVREDAPDKAKSEKFLDRTKQLRRDESRDRLSVSGESSGKRHRSSATPPHAFSEKEGGGEAPVKRRRLDVDGKDKRRKSTASPDDRLHKGASSRGDAPKVRKVSDHRDDEERKGSSRPRKTEASTDHGRRESAKSSSTEKSIHVKSEDADVEMQDVDHPLAEAADVKVKIFKAREEEKKKQADAAVAAAAAAAAALEAKQNEEDEEDEAEAMRIAEEEKRKQEIEREKKRREEEAKRRHEEEAAEKRRKEEEKKRREEEEKKRKEEQEAEARRLREAEERRRLEEEEKLRKAAEEEARKRREEEERERKRREEEERNRREEEERLKKEQLEREAAELARRKKEEEERKEQERLRELERRRAAREAEQRRLFLEQEAIRLQKLPPLLRWLDGCPQPKTAHLAQKFGSMQGVRYDCIRPDATGTSDGREQWLLNTQVALLLGEKDLELSRYTAWERVPVSRIAKIMIWRIEADRYALTTPGLYELGSQLPGYYGGEDPERMGYKLVERLRAEAWEKFLEMELFFVKASELMFIVPTIPHLRNLKLTMAYKELPEDGSLKWQSCEKWKVDPDANRFYGFAPGNKYYVNGDLVHEQTPGLSPVSKTPFPENPVPRRGLAVVSPNDPEYARLCREQGLHHLLRATFSPSPSSPHSAAATLPNGVSSSSPTASAAATPSHSGKHADASNSGARELSPKEAVLPDPSSFSAVVNGTGAAAPSAGAQQNQQQTLVNGVLHATTNGDRVGDL